MTPIEDLELRVRAYNCLKLAGISTVEELKEALRFSRLFYVSGRKTWAEFEWAIDKFEEEAK